MRISILVWGTCRLVGNKSLHIKYTFLDSCAELELPTEMSKLKPFIEVQIEGSIPFPYLVDKFTFIPSHWTEQTTNLSELEHDMLFCQLISTVVHELPFNFMAKAHPVRPLWAYDVVETQIRLLLGQVAEGQISLEKIKSGKDFVPACVYLHGDAFESNDGPGVSDIPRSAEDEIESEGESQAGVDDAEEIPELAEGLMTHLNTLESSRAGLEITDESDWYITGSNGIKYQIAAPTVSSRSSTPASHQQSSPAKETADSTASALEEDTIKYIHARLVEHRAHQHPSRVSYWKQLKESTLGDSGIGLITTHLWLSSLLHLPSEHCFYIDPPLLDQLVACYKNDPLGTTADHVPLLFNRHRLWAQMGSTAHILALAHVPEVCGAELSWLLLDIEVQEGRVNMIELIVPPCGAFNNDAFADLVSFFLGALSRVLPGPKLSSNTSRVQQRTKTLILPQLATEESVFLVLLGYLLGKMLGQAVPAVDVKTMRQSVCYYYNHALRSSKVDLSFPWPGLTDPKGKLLTEENSEEVGRRQFMLASNREASPFEMFPRRRSYTTTLVTPGPSEPFFQELAQSNSSHPEGILVGTTGRSLPDLEKAVFLGRYSSFKKKFPDSLLQVPEALSLEQYVQLVQELGGPESEAARELLLLGKHNGQRITVDWLKDAIYPKPEQMFASYDLDSVSRSSHEAPKLLKAGTYYPRPDRRFGLTTGNELYINLEGKKIGMHTCPNFCIMSLGDNNQFRLLVFLPGCRNRVDRLWRNMARESEMQDWYHTFLTALRILSTQVPLSWQHAVEKTIEALPTTYRMASEQQNKGGGLYSSTGYRVEPFILNSVFRIMRTIIDTTPQLAKYRGYFFHLVGMNLKLATMNIHGQMDDNPLQHALSPFDFTDWFAGNPHDLVADIGWTANIDRNAMPVDLQTTTMLFRTDPFAELAAAAYKKGQIDHYCSSHVVGGWRSTPLASGQSIGWNWTVKQALRIGNKDKFTNQMSGFLNVVKDADSYGVRFEVRVPAWGANQVMKMNARDILDRLTAAETIVCYPTATISAFKSTLCRGWSSIINKQSQLAPATRKSPEVVLLTSVLAYWLKSLIKRPDNLSASTQMATGLRLIETTQSYGIPSLRSASLGEDGLRMSYVVEAERFNILALSGLTVQAGPDTQDNNTFRAVPLPDPLQSPPPSPPRPLTANQLWPQSSEDFLQALINTHLPRALWGQFPRDRLSGTNEALRLRKQPLQRKHWSKIVEPLNTTMHLNGKFLDSVDRLFPLNWTATQTTGDMAAYDRDFLERIRDHVKTKPAKAQADYSSELRRRIRNTLMEKWDYLPNVQNHRMWTYNYNGGQTEKRIFRICPKST
ncbi:hypothetical protein RSOL_406770, partial [Rhizoctonia solani AG-3 Rhs1AP]